MENIKITFLGTKGEIEEENPKHKKNTAILIEHKRKNILIDFGYSHKGKWGQINPDLLFITHSHPDHIGGLPETIDIPVVLSEKTLKLMDKYRFEEPHTEKSGEFFGWLKYEMIPVEHSILAPAVGYVLEIENKRVGVFTDFLKIKEEDKLRGIDILIADGSSIKNDIARKYNIGHQSMQNTLKMAEKLDIKKVVFTHFGKEVVEVGDDNVKEQLESKIPFLLMGDDESIKLTESIEEITDQKLAESFEETKKELIKRGIINQEIKAITYIPHFVSLVGSKVRGEDTENSDWDIVIRKADRDISVELLIRNYFGKEKNYHFIYNPYGPHGDYIPLFDLKLIPKPFQVIRVEESFKPFQLYTPPKMGAAYSFEEFFDINELYEQWAKAYLDRGINLYVETKVNGWRTTIHKKGDDIGMFYEGTEKNRIDIFPKLKEELLKIKDDFIIDAELVGRRITNDEIIPRKDLTIFNGKNEIDCDEFETSEREKGYVNVIVFDCVFYNDDISNLPLKERKEYVEKFAKYKYLSIVTSIKVTNKDEFFNAIKKVSGMQGSEGAVIKAENSIYSVEEIPDWAKFKKILEFKVKVKEIMQTKDKRAYNYIVTYLNDGEEVELCKTMNTKIEANVGDILTLTAEEIILYKEDKRFYISAQIPRVQDIDLSRKTPERIEEIVYKAKKTGLLHCSEDLEKEFLKAYKLKEGWVTIKGRRVLIGDFDDKTTRSFRQEYISSKFKFIETPGSAGEQHALRHSCWKSKDDMYKSIQETIKKGNMFIGKDGKGRGRVLFYNTEDKTLVIAGEKGIFNAYRVTVPDADNYIYRLTANCKVGIGGKL